MNWRCIPVVVLVHFLLSGNTVNGQEEIYRLNKTGDPVTIAAAGATGLLAWILTEQQEPPGENVIRGLDRNDVWKPERWVLDQDPVHRGSFATVSDVGMGVAFAAPAFLLASGKARKEWPALLVMYVESQILSYNLVQWTKLATNRIRPVAYFEDLPMDEKNMADNRNSFFSGHTTFTATASFFIARVISDLHPELGNKKYLVYVAAILPPAFVGAMRVKALKHFPTDVVTGIAAGVISGILVPGFHKNRSAGQASLVPVFGPFTGMALTVSF